jgi:RND family efflux transporter MFP subunit
VRQVERASVVRVGGTVEAYESSEIGFQVAGRVRRMAVEEGQRVSAGQLIAELDPADYQFGADASAGEAAAARAVADKAHAGARKQELEQARAAWEQADDEYRRMKTLFERKSLAPNDFKKIEARWKVTRETYDQAREGARREDISAADAKAHQAQAGSRASDKKVADTKLRAPIEGVIARRLADTGEMVAAGMPVVSVMKLNPARVRVGVPESEIGKVRIGRPARIWIPSMAGRVFTGHVELLGYAAEPASRTFAIRLLVRNPQLELRAGMIAEAEIEGDSREQVLSLPGEAVERDPQGATFVWVYSADKGCVYARRVEVGRGVSDEVEITRGVQSGERVVIAGGQKLREGARVEVRQ